MLLLLFLWYKSTFLLYSKPYFVADLKLLATTIYVMLEQGRKWSVLNF